MLDYSDLDRQIAQLRKCEIIKESEVKTLCSKAREILVEESNVQRVDSPVTVRMKIESKEASESTRPTTKWDPRTK
uniref:Serine/threonine-protein phosphatase 4 catalytic subunit n=1 Tax=Caligus rogercresseyi TaxID=217165 RepID=C1BR06_CALRO|nr:Serine/threonine-protein phosphatase 4 catalytic subunit [Caligus rogercresseyi]